MDGCTGVLFVQIHTLCKDFLVTYAAYVAINCLHGRSTIAVFPLSLSLSLSLSHLQPDTITTGYVNYMLVSGQEAPP